MIKLTNNAISTMFSQGSGRGDRFIVQAQNVKVKDDEFLKMDIKDPTTSVKAVLYISRPQLNIPVVCKKINNQDRYLIKITEFKTIAKSDKLVLEILDFFPLTQIIPPNTKLQDSPKNLHQKNVKQQEKQEVKTEKKQVPNNRRPIQSMSYNQNSIDRDEEQFEDVTEEQLKQFQKISDLYIDFQGRWEIVVRVIEKSYREFTNKSNKLTKIFNMTLIDRTGMKIEGVMFGQNAKQYHDLIQLNHVYRMSRGQVREQNYNQSKGKQYSRYNIIFSKNSVFIPISEVKSIPRGQDNDNTLEQIINESNFDKTYTFAAILLEIGEERNIEKEDRTIFKKTLTVGDPETKKSIEVIIWNKDLYIDTLWVERTILLKNFRLHSYKDVTSFSSIFRSEITLKQHHSFNRYEGKYSMSQYEPISGARQEKVPEKEKQFRYIKQIQNELMYASSSEPVISDLEVWVTHMVFKGKWYYDACNNPKCKKQAESNNKCFHCGHNNGIAQRRFILPIQLSDFSGSIWTTAFDEFSHEVFKGLNIEQLAKMDESHLKEEAQCRLYQQFKLRIASKKQAQGNVKHSIVGKALEMSIEKASISNIEKIKRALY